MPDDFGTLCIKGLRVLSDFREISNKFGLIFFNLLAIYVAQVFVEDKFIKKKNKNNKNVIIMCKCLHQEIILFERDRVVQKTTPEVNLEPCWTSTMQLFCEINWGVLAINCFLKKSPSEILGWVLGSVLKINGKIVCSFALFHWVLLRPWWLSLNIIVDKALGILLCWWSTSVICYFPTLF